MCWVGPRLYAVGVCDDGDNLLSSVEKEDSEWEAAAGMGSVRARVGVAALRFVVNLTSLTLVHVMLPRLRWMTLKI